MKMNSFLQLLGCSKGIKTSISSKVYPSWLYLKRPDIRILARKLIGVQTCNSTVSLHKHWRPLWGDTWPFKQKLQWEQEAYVSFLSLVSTHSSTSKMNVRHLSLLYCSFHEKATTSNDRCCLLHLHSARSLIPSPAFSMQYHRRPLHLPQTSMPQQMNIHLQPIGHQSKYSKLVLVNAQVVQESKRTSIMIENHLLYRPRRTLYPTNTEPTAESDT